MRDMQPGEHDEIEVKWRLEAAGHARLEQELTALLGAPRRLQQHNVFYDSVDFRLRAARVNLRLRSENGRVLLTCKARVAGAEGSHFQHHREWECWIQIAPELLLPGAELAWGELELPDWIRAPLLFTGAADAVSAAADAAADAEAAPLRCLGGFANLRLEWSAPHGELVCLDRTDLGVRVDYELEIETADPAVTTASWQDHLNGWAIAPVLQRESKFARFVALAQARAVG